MYLGWNWNKLILPDLFELPIPKKLEKQSLQTGPVKWQGTAIIIRGGRL